ncbi:MAG: UvrD-helicase domain-containing protein [Synechococcaceae cyanobacterium]|nr:UvrD-helicase domain-containing protein [Synechococcaceae cyanobacterium]
MRTSRSGSRRRPRPGGADATATPSPDAAGRPGPAASAAPELQPFEANGFPLHPGVRLLEASAGTGKTFALAHLVLRLISEAGHGIRQLLVVTFTEAAAAELRDRIARRLQQALQGLAGDPQWQPPDPVLADWLAGQPDPRIRRLWQGRLLLALEELDAADITTIHGFCRRTLCRQALEAGLPPRLGLDDDPEQRLQEIVHDYWQQQVLGLPIHLVGGLRRGGLSPEELVGLLRLCDGDPALQLDPLPESLPRERPLPEVLPALWEAWRDAFVRLWQDRGEALIQDLRAIAQDWRDRGQAKTGDYVPKPRTDRLALMAEWLLRTDWQPGYDAVLEQKLLTGFFHPGRFSQEARKVEGASGVPSLPQAELMQAIARLVDGPLELVRLHACHWGRHALQRRRRQAGVMGFSQLLEALDPGPDATGPTPLLQAVAGRYRVALIDEFQDTDPIQWRILRLALGSGDHLLVMVGDPKQAIYRFRGGDLATYLAARQRADARYSLQQNRRSSPALIAALNGLMAGPGDGRSGLPRSGLAVPAVEAAADLHCCAGTPAAALAPVQLLLPIPPRAAGAPLASKTALEAELPDRIALAVLQLLGQTVLLGRGERQQPLQRQDLCILVSTHDQAERIRAALEQRGLASRLVSRADVFASPAATALQRLIDALADPADAGRLRLLAASPLLAWSAAEIAAAPAERWSALAGALDRLAGQLGVIGLIGAINGLLNSEALARLALGGRLLADLQQVAGLVQERLHGEQLSPAAAADWLRRLRLDPDRHVPEAHQAHSDRVDGAIAVVTVHRSKGLEFPVVICPYLWQSAGEGSSERAALRWQESPEAPPRLSLHANRRWGVGWQAARRNRLAEEAERERLAYVAMTRAQHLLLLAWMPASGHACNPLQPMLLPQEPLPQPDEEDDRRRSDEDWRTAIAASLEARQLPVALLSEAPPDAERPPSPSPPAAGSLSCGPVPQRRLDTLWGRSSYSSWTRSSHGAAADPASLDQGRDTADPDPDPSSAADPAGPERRAAGGAAWSDTGPLAGFPRGSGPGECLHRVLERLDFQQPAHPTTEPSGAADEIVAQELRRAGLAADWQVSLLEGLEQLRHTPFGGPLGGWSLQELPAQQRLNELQFDLSLGLIRARDLEEAFAAHPGGSLDQAYASRLATLPVENRGFLTGSIDLACPITTAAGERRWWVIDWKSNWLGRRDAEGHPLGCGPADYLRPAMAELMAARHYHLQAHLYLVALHRYLGWRQPGYDPGQHLGGYAYVFLRGVPGALPADQRPQEVPGVFLEQPPLSRLLALDQRLGGRP